MPTLKARDPNTGNYVPLPLGILVTDHGSLLGLSDDDHPQYALKTQLSSYVLKAGDEITGVLTVTGADKGLVLHSPGVSVVNLASILRNGRYMLALRDSWAGGTGNLATVYCGGVDFGAQVAGAATDLSKHLTLYSDGGGNNYGLSITGSRLNVMAASGASVILGVPGADFLNCFAGAVVAGYTVYSVGGAAPGMVVNSYGISYPGFTAGGGGTNMIGMRWASPNILGGVDNVNSCVLGTVSSRDYKTGIVPLQSRESITLLNRLRPNSYEALDHEMVLDPQVDLRDAGPKPKVKKRNTGRRHYGLVADEVAQVIPSAVVGGSVNYTELVPLLVGAVKDLSARVTELETRLAAIEGAA